MSERACRICGCVESRACVTEGVACHWVEPDLCSACFEKKPASPQAALSLAYERFVREVQLVSQSPGVVLIVFHRDKPSEVIAALGTEANNNFGAMMQSIADQVNGVSGKVTEGLYPPETKGPDARAPGP